MERRKRLGFRRKTQKQFKEKFLQKDLKARINYNKTKDHEAGWRKKKKKKKRPIIN